MLRYTAAALALKPFSLPGGSRLYRSLANVVGGRRRVATGPTEIYMERMRAILDTCRALGGLTPGSKVLEVGTGWVHWEATVLRLAYDIEATLLDVWDNRQFRAYQEWAGALRDKLTWAGIARERQPAALSAIDAITTSSTIDEVYSRLGFRYVLDPSRTLDGVDGTYDLIVSTSVLEHVDAQLLPEFLANMRRLLVPDGQTVHLIDLGDHLSYYDANAHDKNYLRYTDRTWRLWFANRVHYFNRVQRSDWMDLFNGAGLRLISERREDTALAGLPISSAFSRFGAADLACRNLTLIHGR